MLHCFIGLSGQSSVPIIPLTDHQLNQWLQQQPPRVQNWVQSTAYRPKSGAIGLLCDEEGKLDRVLVGMAHEQDWGVFGLLAANLPKGAYRIESNLTPSQYYHAFLAWGLASYQFTPYKKFPPLEAKLALPEPADLVDLAYLEAILRATYLVRDLINTPADDMTPADIAEAAIELGEEFGAQVKKL